MVGGSIVSFVFVVVVSMFVICLFVVGVFICVLSVVFLGIFRDSVGKLVFMVF